MGVSRFVRAKLKCRAPCQGTAPQRGVIPPGNCRSSRYVEYSVMLFCAFVRRIWPTLGRREAPAGKKRSGPGKHPHRCQKCLPGRELGVAGWQGFPVRLRTCVRNGPAPCQGQCERNRTTQSEFQHPNAATSGIRNCPSVCANAMRGICYT